MHSVHCYSLSHIYKIRHMKLYMSWYNLVYLPLMLGWLCRITIHDTWLVFDFSENHIIYNRISDQSMQEIASHTVLTIWGCQESLFCEVVRVKLNISMCSDISLYREQLMSPEKAICNNHVIQSYIKHLLFLQHFELLVTRSGTYEHI